MHPLALEAFAWKLHSLGDLCRAIRGVLNAAGASEAHKVKLDNKALVAMFHAYRVPILEFLASDASYNFEALRSTVQEGFRRRDSLTSLSVLSSQLTGLESPKMEAFTT